MWHSYTCWFPQWIRYCCTCGRSSKWQLRALHTNSHWCVSLRCRSIFSHAYSIVYAASCVLQCCCHCCHCLQCCCAALPVYVSCEWMPMVTSQLVCFPFAWYLNKSSFLRVFALNSEFRSASKPSYSRLRFSRSMC